MAHNPNELKPETIQRIVTVFDEVLGHGLEKPHTRIPPLPLTDRAIEVRRNIERTVYPCDSSVIDVVRP